MIAVSSDRRERRPGAHVLCWRCCVWFNVGVSPGSRDRALGDPRVRERGLGYLTGLP